MSDGPTGPMNFDSTDFRFSVILKNLALHAKITLIFNIFIAEMMVQNIIQYTYSYIEIKRKISELLKFLFQKFSFNVLQSEKKKVNANSSLGEIFI